MAGQVLSDQDLWGQPQAPVSQPLPGQSGVAPPVVPVQTQALAPPTGVQQEGINAPNVASRPMSDQEAFGDQSQAPAPAPLPAPTPQTQPFDLGHYVGQEVIDNVGGAFDKLKGDAAQYYQDTVSQKPKSLGDQMREFMAVPRLAGDAFSAAVSPATAAIHGAVIRPAATALSQIPQYAAPTSANGYAPTLVPKAQAEQEWEKNLGLLGFAAAPGEAPGAGMAAADSGILGTAAKVSPRAAKYMGGLLGSPDPAMVAAHAAGKPVTTAEMLGPSGRTALAATARRPGATGSMVEDTMTDRLDTAPHTMLRDFTDATGISPHAARGDMEALAESNRQGVVRPAYDAALSQPVTMTPHLSAVLQQPEVIAAVNKAKRLVGTDSTIIPVDGAAGSAAEGQAVPPHNASGGTLTADNAGNLKFTLPDGREISGKIRFIGHGKGGILDVDESGINSFGVGPVRDMLFAIKQQYPEMEALMGSRETGARGASGGSLASIDMRRIGPSQLPAVGAQPNAVVLDQAKKFLAREITRDPITKEPVASGPGASENVFIQKHLGDLTDALAGNEAKNIPPAIPGYRDALNAAGDTLKTEQAFKLGKQHILNSGVSAADVEGVVQKMSPSELEAYQGGQANALFDKAQSGLLTPKKLLTQTVRNKLAMSLGNDRADAFLTSVRHTKQMGDNARQISPQAGSQTNPLSAEMGRQDNPGGLRGILGPAPSEFATGALVGLMHGPHGALQGGTGLAGVGIARRLAGSARGVLGEVGMPTAVRDEVGGILGATGDKAMTPDQLETYLQSIRPKRIPQKVPALTWVGRPESPPPGILAAPAAGMGLLGQPANRNGR